MDLWNKATTTQYLMSVVCSTIQQRTCGVLVILRSETIHFTSVSHDQKNNFAPHFNHLVLTNAIVPLMTPSANMSANKEYVNDYRVERTNMVAKCKIFVNVT